MSEVLSTLLRLNLALGAAVALVLVLRAPVRRLFGGEVAPLVANFAEHRALTPKDLELLKQLIAKLEDE